MITRLACLVAVAGVLASCSPPTATDIETQVKQATAEALPQVAMDSVEIRGIERGAAKTAWEVHTPSAGSYACSSDELMRMPSCSKL